MATGFYSTPMNPFGVISILVWLLAAAIWVHNIHFTAYCGAQDFSQIDSHSDGKSPFAVGIRHLKVTGKKLEASVFYPIDKETARNDGYWFRNPEKTMDAMVKVFGPMFNIPWLPRFILRSYTSIRFPITENADIVAKFASGQTKMRPIIFSHGLSGDKTFYTVLYHALAAQGYMVIAVNHQDESCFFTEDKDGKEMGFVLKPFYVEPYRKQQLKTRVDEIVKTREALKEMSFDLHVDLFGAAFPNVKLDMNELVLAGHSFGSATVIAVASQLKESE